MSRTYFGTDGIRGRVGTYPLTPEGISRIAQSAGRWVLAQPLAEGKIRHLVVLGRDTRASGDWINACLEGVFCGLGIGVVQLGVAPTPAIANETVANGATLGIATTASHNPHRDNGLKFFASDGFKLSDADEDALEGGLAEPVAVGAASEAGGEIRQARQWHTYLERLHAAGGGRTRQLRLVVDGANGAAAHLLAGLFPGAVLVGDTPDGLNINDGVGAAHTETLAARVVAEGAYAGIALDGDADRLIMADETGAEVDGDQLIALLARDMHAAGMLKGGKVVTTVMSNLGLERFLAGLGLDLVRTPVGDRHVVQAMREGGFNLGGEQSGHIVLLDHGTTGDGLMAALKVLSIAESDGRPFSAFARVFEPVPQRLVNVRFSGANPLDDDRVKQAIDRVSRNLGSEGRVLVRKSGTEPLIRIMVEAIDHAVLTASLAELEQAVHSARQEEV